MSKRLNWYWNRLRLMSPAEIMWRVRQQMEKRLSALGWGLCIRPPAAQWPSGQAPFTVLRGLDETADDLPQLLAKADALLAGRWSVFALDDLSLGFPPQWNRDPKTGTLAPLKRGKGLNYRDERLVGDIKYLWEPSRHLELVTLCLAWRATKEQRYLDAALSLLGSWLDQCPYPLGVHWTSSLELAIRLLNWSLAWQILGGQTAPVFHSEQGRALLTRWMSSVYQHQHFIRGYLSRHSSANNHLFGEYMGLFVAGVTWPCWKESAQWVRMAQAGLEEEAQRQNHTDGVNKEQAIYYHHEVMDMMLLTSLYGQASGHPFSSAYLERLRAMSDFLSSMSSATGQVPMIGDADDAHMAHLSFEVDHCVYRSLLASCACLFDAGHLLAKAGRIDAKTRRLFGQAVASTVQPAQQAPRLAFPHGGYWLLGSHWNTEREVRVVLDAGELGYLSIAAHGHADALALVLLLGGREWLIDPGTYAYHTQKVWRDHFRSTAAHNTVEVDGVDQSEIGGNFMWLRKARARLLTHDTASAIQSWSAEHDGYTRLSDPVTHCRSVRWDAAAGTLTVRDELRCVGAHSVRLSWHLHEDLDPRQEDGVVLASAHGWSLRFGIDAQEFALQLQRGVESPPAGWVSRRFDERRPATVATWIGPIEGDTVITTTFQIQGPA